MLRTRLYFGKPILTLVFVITLTVAGPAGAEGPYTPPDTKPGEKGWADYVNPRMLDASTARGLTPRPDTPEAAVVLFLASRIRGDDAWKRAMTAEPSGRTKRKLAKWAGWTLRKAQLKARKLRGESRGYVRVWFEIEISGKTDSGTDEFTVRKEGGGWRIKEPPT